MIPIAFDVLGTCYSLDAAITAIEAAFGKAALEKANVNPALLVEDWFHTSQRDFTYTSMNGHFMSVCAISPPFAPELTDRNNSVAVQSFKVSHPLRPSSTAPR